MDIPSVIILCICNLIFHKFSKNFFKISWIFFKQNKNKNKNINTNTNLQIMSSAIYSSANLIKSLPKISEGKVRDIYAVGDDKMLIITSDRLSAFDVIMNEPIPHKGAVLTGIANFWFDKLQNIVPNQLTGIAPESVVNASDPQEINAVKYRAVVVKKLFPLPIEAVVRGYIIGSGWKDYQQSGKICGISLPSGLRQAAKLPEPIFTPATKAAVGEHDENVDFETACEHCQKILNPFLQNNGVDLNKINGKILCEQAKQVAVQLYNQAADFAKTKGIIIADTKFEFGIDNNGVLHLIDEVITPDSSRFWSVETWKEDSNPPSFDKQPVRDYLETLDWNKKAPAPKLSAEIIQQTSERYIQAYEKITGENRSKIGA